jgi:tetratricopeptide (TPR) repeat protein
MEGKLQTKIEEAWEYYTKDNLKKASSLCKPLLGIKKHALNANYLLGLISYDEKDFKTALKYLNDALSLDTTKKSGGFINYWIGRTYEYSESWLEDDNPIYDKKKAAETYLEAKGYSNYPADTIFKLASGKDSDFEKQQLYEEALQKFPLESDFYIYLSSLYKRLGYQSKQLQTLDLAIKKGIRTASLYFNLAEYYYAIAEYQIAIKYLNDCIKLNTNNKACQCLYYSLGNSLFNLKQYDKAIFYYKKSINIDKTDDSLWYAFMGLAICLYKKKKINEIIKFLDQIPFDRNLFEYESFDFELIAHLDGRMSEGESFRQDPMLLITIFLKIKQGVTDNISLVKISLLLSALYDHTNNFLEKLKILRSCILLINKYEFIENRIVEAYSNNTSSDNFSDEIVDYFLEDISLGYLQEDSAKRIGESLIEKLFDQKKYNKVMLVCGSFSERQIGNMNILFQYAYSLKANNKSKEAKYYYEKYLKSSPKSSAALNNLGVIHQELGELEKAISLYKEAIKYGADDELYQNNLKITSQLLEKRFQEEKQKKIPEHWNSSIKNINVNRLDDWGYFEIIQRIEKINKKYKKIIERDFKELFFNYLVNNYKSTVVLSGSLVEMIIIYYCDKKNFKMIPVKNSKGSVQNKKLYDCVLNELIPFIGDKNIFGTDFHHLGNLARIYRNYIHPALELKSNTDIKSKADLCFISAIEIIKKII